MYSKNRFRWQKAVRFYNTQKCVGMQQRMIKNQNWDRSDLMG